MRPRESHRGLEAFSWIDLCFVTGMTSLPRATGFDRTRSFFRAPYTFIAATCEHLQSDVFETRLFLQRAICLRGEEAAALFGDDTRFERHYGSPSWLRTLLGRAGVQDPDSATHRAHKTLLLSLLDTESLAQARRLFVEEWASSLPCWETQGKVELYREMQAILTRVACAWTGIPLLEVDVNRRTKDLVKLFDAGGRFRSLETWRARRRVDAWLLQLIRRVRAGGSVEPHSALERLARSKLSEKSAVAELCNLIRPVVALSGQVVFLALALYRHPRAVPRNEDERIAFIREVRRFYPFSPAVVARVKQDFEWRGARFPAGRRVFLDLYGTNHHPGAWKAPNDFRPDRFLRPSARTHVFEPRHEVEPMHHERGAEERLMLVLLDETLLQLTKFMICSVPPQDLRVDMTRIPALPRSRMILDKVRARTLPASLRPPQQERSQVVPIGQRKLA